MRLKNKAMKQNIFDIIVAAVCTGATFLFGTWDVALVALLVFIALDYITGVACAVIKKELSSRSGAAGLFKKALILVIIIAAVLLDRLLSTEWVIRSAACYFYIANEGISILENTASIGLPVPKRLIDILKQLENEDKDGGKKNNDDKNDHHDTDER